ncbi:Aspartate carbamoyltransferase, chloroplastic [Capsicum annuum]|uniref:Aspartate carbamoyltransferase, chloroplastic n=1 Tax=Capsicum annuum TaxID=4072 RepID=A0A2G2YZB0_CAPAN|nr:Aspartate carbamoyltransferase, chloroplastic [Capsicum annuum]
MASEVSSMLRNQVAERVSVTEKASILQAELDSRTRRLETEKNELQSILEKEFIFVPSEVHNFLYELVYMSCWHVVLKKDENINQLTNDLQECMKELGIVKAILPKVFQERDFMWKEVKSYSEMNILLNYEINMLERKNLHLRSLCCCLKLMFKFSFLTVVHQNSTCGAAENVGTAPKPNGIMHEPVRADRPNAFSPSTFELKTTLLLGLAVKVVLEPKIPSLHNQPSFLTLETDITAIENVFNLKGIRALHLGLLYVGSLVVLRMYSILYGLIAKESNGLGATTSVALIILGSSFPTYIFIRLREGFRRKDQNSFASSSEGCGSSVKRNSSADAGHLGNTTVPCTSDGSTWNNIEGINSDKSIDSGRPSLALRSSSCHLVVQEPEVGSSYVDRNLEHNSSLVVCSSSGLESQGGDSSTSTSANQQILDLNLALAFQEKLSDPRIKFMLKRKGRHTDRELANLLQDKGLDRNFAVMLKKNGLDPMILALLQRSSLHAHREHRNSNPPVTDSNDVEDVLPNHISFSEELKLQGLGKWLQHCRVMLHRAAGTLERAWLLFSLIFILETVVVAIFRPKTIKLLNATHQQPRIPPLDGPAPGVIPSMSLITGGFDYFSGAAGVSRWRNRENGDGVGGSTGEKYGYRMSLWTEHTTTIEQFFEHPESLECVRRMRVFGEHNWLQYTTDKVTEIRGHLLKYPVEIDRTGKVKLLHAYGRKIHSVAHLFAKYQDVKIYFVSPDVVKMKDDIKDYLTSMRVHWEESDDLLEVASKFDVVYQTHIQRERFGERVDLYEESRGKYIVDLSLLNAMQKHAVVMHPLPRLD